MELDEMKQAWVTLGLRQERTDKLLHAALRDRQVQKSRRAMLWSLLWQGLEIGSWLAFVLWVATFWFANRHTPHLLVMGLLLHVYGLGAIWSSVRQLFLLARIYRFDAPVLVQQRRLAQLRRFRFYSTLLLGLPWWCLWLLVPLVALKDFTGVDLYAIQPGWIWLNMAVGGAGIGVCLWLARRLAGRPVRSLFLQRMVDDMSGRSLLRASRQLDEIVRFEAA